MGSRALLHGVDPYTRAFTEQIQRRMFWKVLTDPAADSQAFVYPAHSALLLAPLAALPWQAARFLLTAVLPLLLVAAAWLWADMCGVRRSRWFLIALAALSWPAIWAYRQTQLTVVVLLAIALACYLLSRNRDGLAGAALAVATMKPNLSLLLIAWLLLQTALQRRWRFWIGLGIPAVFLLGLSQFLWPRWVSQWLAAVSQYSGPYKPPLLMLELGHLMGIVAIGLLGAGILLRLWTAGVTLPGSPAFAYAVAIILAFTTCIIPTSMWLIYNELAVIPAVFLIFSLEQRRNAAHALAMIAVGVVLGMVPVCAAIYAVIGFRVVLGFLPFMTALVVPVVTVALASRGPTARGTHETALPVPVAIS